MLLIVVDTLRADHLGAYGYQRRETSPHFDTLAARATRFDRAYAAAAWTLPSVASIVTGLDPRGHGATTPGLAISDAVETLAETFRGAGFATGGVVSNAHLKRGAGFARGFDLWSERNARGHRYVSSRGVTADAIDMLEQLDDEPAAWFLFVHYFDPHFAYIDHDEFAYAPSSAPTLDGEEPMSELKETAGRWSAADREFLLGRYDEEIRATDAAIGELLDWLSDSGTLERTVVAFTADHGESFGEAGEIGHGTLREEVIRVPLLLKPARAGGARVIAEPVSLISVAPTLLELAGVEADPQRFGAASLADRLVGDPTPERTTPVFSEILWLQSVVDGHHKLVLDNRRGRSELFDLASDPDEKRDLSRRRKQLGVRLRTLIRERQATRRAPAPVTREIDSETRAMLRELGYTEEGAPDIGP